MNSFIIKEPKTRRELDLYYFSRWQILRKPLGKKKGSEKDEYEKESFHLMIIDGTNDILAVGRIHVINCSSNIIKAQVRYMGVTHQKKRQGLGTKILKGLEEYAKNNNVGIVLLNARENAIHFYEKNGYQVIDKAATYATIKHWRMEKRIEI